LRYKRLAERKAPDNKDKDLRYRSIPRKDAESRDLAELENLNKGGTIAMADYTIVNTKSLDYFRKQLNEIEKEIKKNR
jgi:dephospho-CoA kinase